MHAFLRPWGVVLSLTVVSACSAPTNKPPSTTGVTPSNHMWFPIEQGVHAVGASTPSGVTISCESCHPATAVRPSDISCIGCHEHVQPVTDRLHTSTANYKYESAACYSCHPAGEKVAFDHVNITSDCASCHEVAAPFAALPVAGFTHPDVGQTDCSACHSTKNWKDAKGGPTDLTHDTAASITVMAQVPSYSATSITSVTAESQVLPMEMNHAAASLPAAAVSNCSNCHPTAASGQFYPGNLHGSLNALGLAAPTACTECHVNGVPTGFVGPLASSRTPTTGEMKHDAVAWANNAPTKTALVTQDCATCHKAPDDSNDGTWVVGLDGGVPTLHASLTARGLSQPATCLDCHANTRPAFSDGGVLTAANSSLPAGLAFDHQTSSALGECTSCHTGTAVWSGGKFHATAGKPANCNQCHEGERPTTTTAWASTTWKKSPFDTVENSSGIGHGGDQDCATCHQSTSTWVGGNFTHGPMTLSASTCIACHTTQRPDLALSATMTPAQVADLLKDSSDAGFDHATNGRGECFGCHQATVAAGSYVAYFNAAGKLPGGDWKDGQRYPGSTFASSSDEYITVTEYTLTRSGSNNLVTGITQKNGVKYSNGMLHVSAQVPAELNAGPSNNPNNALCWHCHTNVNGTVTELSGGKFHDSLTNYSATFGGTVMPFPQPTKCNDCHKQMRPQNIVELADAGVNAPLHPMDHAATFTASVNIGGVTAAGVADLDCSTCHASPGKTWGDGLFHKNIATATPADCTTCHYPLMADATKSDLANANGSVMAHKSTLVTNQNCSTCHASALSKSTTTPVTAALFKTGQFHANLASQPTSCNECHSNSKPATTKPSSTVYTLALGATSTNQAQYANHATAAVTGKDCSVCHLADAKKTGAAWSPSTPLHAFATGLTTCDGCHGTTNGLGTVIGTNNNLPLGLTNSTTVTTASNNAATGIAVGTLDQIDHSDLNVTKYNCNLCHTQAGPSNVVGVKGKEWAVASFHKNLTGANALVANGTTARCSHCHMNVKPTNAFTTRDHSGFTNTSPEDCAGCHAYPAWPTTADKPHGDSGTTAGATYDCNSCHGQGGSASVHLSVPAASHYGGNFKGNTCISCHINYAGFKGTTANLLYGHTGFSTTSSTNCGLCHAFSSGTYTTLTSTPKLTFPVSGQASQFSQATSVTARFNGEGFTSNHQNTNMTDCSTCHRYVSTTATTNVWSWVHQGTVSTKSDATFAFARGANGCSMCHKHQ